MALNFLRFCLNKKSVSCPSEKNCVIGGKAKIKQEKLFHPCFLNWGYKIQNDPVDSFGENVERSSGLSLASCGTINIPDNGVNFMPFCITDSFIHSSHIYLGKIIFAVGKNF